MSGMRSLNSSSDPPSRFTEKSSRSPILEIDSWMPSKIQAISPLVDRLMRLIKRSQCVPGAELDVELALREALGNAVLHGNEYDKNKRVNLTLEHKGQELIVTITDEGPGFVPEEVPDPLAPENLLKGSGRGIFLMRAFMDEVRFRKMNPGTEIILIKRLQNNDLDRQEAST